MTPAPKRPSASVNVVAALVLARVVQHIGQHRDGHLGAFCMLSGRAAVAGRGQRPEGCARPGQRQGEGAPNSR